LPALIKQPLTASFAFSVVLHVFLLFGIGISLPTPRNIENSLQPLEVVLVNSKSRSRPVKADALAQNNLDGGGNTAQDRRAKNPLPTLSNDERFTPEQSARQIQQLEQEARNLLTRIKSDHSVPKVSEQEQQQQVEPSSGEDLAQRSLEIARLEAQINKEYDAYQKLPRRKFIGARTQEYRFAQYVEDWRIKVERIGNLNYPETARQKRIYGTLQLTVSIRADGSVENVEISRPSGQPILDAAAQRIVRLAAPFPPFPPDIRKDTDILSITRTWTFTQTDKLESE
jgi:protein TonB